MPVKPEPTPIVEPVASDEIDEEEDIENLEEEEEESIEEQKETYPYGTKLSDKELMRVEELIKQDMAPGEQVVIHKAVNRARITKCFWVAQKTGVNSHAKFGKMGFSCPQYQHFRATTIHAPTSRQQLASLCRLKSRCNLYNCPLGPQVSLAALELLY